MRTSRQYDIKTEALKGITNDNTLKSYKKNIDTFVSWEKDTYGKKFDKNDKTVNTEHIQAYEKYLESKGTSPATIHTRLAPVCKGLSIEMKDIEKPLRTAGTLIRDRDPAANSQGKRELRSPLYKKGVELSRAIGVRRSELSHLTKENLKYDESGNMCVEVLRGKGGKYQLQRILPQHQDTVRKYFEAAEPGQRILSPKEISAHVSYHSLRAEVAKEAYDTYKKAIDTIPGYREKLINELSERFKAEHRHGKEGYSKQAYEKFMGEILKESAYELRGTSKEWAIKNGRPTTLDRVAVMAVSVFHLSHWRTPVAVVNYLNK